MLVHVLVGVRPHLAARARQRVRAVRRRLLRRLPLVQHVPLARRPDAVVEVGSINRAAVELQAEQGQKDLQRCLANVALQRVPGVG